MFKLDDQKLKAIERAIARLQQEAQRNPLPKVTLPRKLTLEDNPNELAHQEFCEDMQALGDASGTPWGGHHGDPI